MKTFLMLALFLGIAHAADTPISALPLGTASTSRDLTPEELTSLSEIVARQTMFDYDATVEALWSAADQYQQSKISGAAIGLLTIGVIQSKPKCLAVQSWIKGIWTEYYARKAEISETTVTSLDFSACGNIPHTVPELMEEVNL